MAGCGKCNCEEGAKTPADEASEAEPPAEAVMEAEPAPAAEEPAGETAEAPPAETKPQAAALPEPKFTPGMSVSEAIAALPSGWEFVGIDPEALGRPLADLKLYEPCKLTPAQHFKMKVAVWDGKAVGIDVSSANKRLAECIKEQVAKVQWREQVKAINTVDYSY